MAQVYPYVPRRTTPATACVSGAGMTPGLIRCNVLAITVRMHAEEVMARQWGNLSSRTRKLIIGAGIAEAILKVAVLIDIRHRPANQIRGSKRLWIVAALLVNSAGVGSLSYLVFGRRRQTTGVRRLPG